MRPKSTSKYTMLIIFNGKAILQAQTLKLALKKYRTNPMPHNSASTPISGRLIVAKFVS